MLNIEELLKIAEEMGATIEYNVPKEEAGLFYLENGIKKSGLFAKEYQNVIENKKYTIKQEIKLKDLLNNEKIYIDNNMFTYTFKEDFKKEFNSETTKYIGVAA